MAHFPTEQEDVNAYPGILQGTDLAGTLFIDMLTMDNAAFELTFASFTNAQKVALRGMRGRYQERRQVYEPSISLNRLYQTNNEYVLLICKDHNDEKSGFKSQCIFDSGSDYSLILPRRKIAQLGLRCMGAGSNVNGGTTQLFPYQNVFVKIPSLDKSAALTVYGVSPQEVEAYRIQENIQPIQVDPIVTTIQIESPPTRKRKSPRLLEMKVTPCKRGERDEIDSDVLIGRTGLIALQLCLDFSENIVKVMSGKRRA